MSYTPTVQKHAAILGRLAQTAEAGNRGLFDAHGNLFQLRRDHKGAVPVTEPRMAAAIAQIESAAGTLKMTGAYAKSLPTGVEPVRHVRQGVTQLGSVLDMLKGDAVDPGKVDDSLPTYMFQEAHLAASRDIRGLNEGLASLAVASSVGGLPKSVDDKRITKLAAGLGNYAKAADTASKGFGTAGKIASTHLENYKAKHPNSSDVVVSDYILNSWGVRPLANKAMGTVARSVHSEKLPPGSDAARAHHQLHETLRSIGSRPTDFITEGQVSLSRVVGALNQVTHAAALVRNEAREEQTNLNLVKAYGRRAK